LARFKRILWLSSSKNAYPFCGHEEEQTLARIRRLTAKRKSQFQLRYPSFASIATPLGQRGIPHICSDPARIGVRTMRDELQSSLLPTAIVTVPGAIPMMVTVPGAVPIIVVAGAMPMVNRPRSLVSICSRTAR
jgi:hypothetical protein